MADLTQLQKTQIAAQNALAAQQAESKRIAAELQAARQSYEATIANNTARNQYGLTQAEWNKYQTIINSWYGNIGPDGKPIQGSIEWFKWDQAGRPGLNPGLGKAVSGPWSSSAISAAEQRVSSLAAQLSQAATKAGMYEEQARAAKAAYEQAIVQRDYEASKQTGVWSKGVSAPVTSSKTETTAEKLAKQATVVTDKSGTKVATPTAGTTAKQSVAADQVKTSATTTAAKTSTAGQAAVKAQTSTPAKTTTTTTTTAPKTTTTTTPAKTTVNQQIEALKNVKESTEKLTIIPAATPQTAVNLSTQQQKIQKIADAQAPKVESREGYLQLADGSWIPQYEAVGSRGAGTQQLETFTESTKERYDTQVKQAASLQAAATQLRSGYSEAVDPIGRIIPAIEYSGSKSTGTQDVRVLATDISKASLAQEYQQKLAGTYDPTKQAIGNVIGVSGSRAEYKVATDLRAAENRAASEAFDTLGTQAARVTAQPMTVTQVDQSALGQFRTTVKEFTADNLKPVQNALKSAEVDVKTLAPIAVKSALDRELTESEAKLLASKTGIGADRTYSDWTQRQVAKLEGVQLSIEKHANTVINALKTAERTVAPVQSAIEGVVKMGPLGLAAPIGERAVEAIKASPTDSKYGVGITTKFAQNIIKNVENRDKIIPELVITASQTPTMVSMMLKEGEYLYKNPDKVISTAAFAVPAVATGIAKAAYDKPITTAAEFYIQGKALSAATKVAGKGISLTGEGTGLVRTKTVPVPDVAVASQTALLESVLLKETVSGARASGVNWVLKPVRGKPIGVQPIEIAGKKYTPGRAIQAVAGEEKQLTRIGDTGNVILTKGGPVTKTYANPVHTSYMSPDLTDGHMEIVSEYFLAGKRGGSRLANEVQIIRDVPTIASELSSAHRQAIQDLAKTGRIDPAKYAEIAELAKAKSARIGQPVAYPSPKTAAGALVRGKKPELEVLLAYGSPESVKITSSAFKGFTPKGYPIREIKFGAADPIQGNILKTLLENAEYNWKNTLTAKSEYNKGMAVFQNRKLAELEGRAPMRPGQYASHSGAHISGVSEAIEEIWRSSPTLKKQYTLKEMKIAAKLHDLARNVEKETYPVKHGQSVAANIRAGRIKDKELLALSQRQQMNVADAIETHMEIMPGLDVKTLVRRPSDIQKALATADRTARARESGKPVRPGTTFKIPEETVGFKLNQALAEAERAIGKSALIRDTRAELAPVRGTRRTATTRTSDAKQKRTTPTKQREIKPASYAEEYRAPKRTKAISRTQKVSAAAYISREASRVRPRTAGKYITAESAKAAEASAYKEATAVHKALDSMAGKYNVRVESADALIYTPKSTGYKPIARGDTPSARGYKPKPKGKEYTPKGEGYKPKPAGYTPSPRGYTPSPTGYTPKPSGYTPRPGRYTPAPAGYTPRPGKYTPRPGKYTPRPSKYDPAAEEGYTPAPADDYVPKKAKPTFGVGGSYTVPVQQLRAIEENIIGSRKKKTRTVTKTSKQDLAKQKRKIKNVLGTLFF